MKKRNKALLVLLALVLVTSLGAKMYSTITMGDDEWIGLGADAGRIVFDDQPMDEVTVLDAHVGINDSTPDASLDVCSFGAGVVSSFDTGTGNYAWNAYQVNDVNKGYLQWNINDAGNSVGTSMIFNNAQGNLMLGSSYSHQQLFLGSSGRVGINDTTPSYALDVNGTFRATSDVRADDDVHAGDDVRAGDDVHADGNVLAAGDMLAGGTAFIGEEEDDDEDGAHMSSRASNDDGGYMFYARRDVTGTVGIFVEEAAGGTSGPVTMLWVQWFVHDVSGPTYTSGNIVLDCLSGGGAPSQTVIAGSGDNTLTLQFNKPIPEGGKGNVRLVEAGSHVFDVSLLMMWVVN